MVLVAGKPKVMVFQPLEPFFLKFVEWSKLPHCMVLLLHYEYYSVGLKYSLQCRAFIYHLIIPGKWIEIFNIHIQGTVEEGNFEHFFQKNKI